MSDVAIPETSFADVIELDLLADRANEAHRQAEGAAYTALEFAREAGINLSAAKALCKHGEWLPWLEANFEGTRFTAARYMRLSEKWAELNVRSCAHLGIRQALELLSEPREIEKDEVLSELELEPDEKAEEALEGELEEPAEPSSEHLVEQLRAYKDDRLTVSFLRHEIAFDTAVLLGRCRHECGPETYAALWEHEHAEAQVRRSEPQLKHLLFLAGKGNGDEVTADLVTLTESGGASSVQAAHKIRQDERKDAEKQRAREEAARIANQAAAAAGISEPLEVKPDRWYQLGKHLLYCGDSSSDAFKARAKGAAFCFADPPYNAEVDTWDSGFVWQHDYLIEAARVVAVTPGSTALDKFVVQAQAMPYRWIFACQITNGMTLGKMGFANWIPTILYSKGSVFKQVQDFMRVTINNAETGDTNYKGRKPYEFVLHLVKLYSEEGELVIDPFVGSGTTLLVCEKANRPTICAELQPSMCEQVISRWQDLTGEFAREFQAQER